MTSPEMKCKKLAYERCITAIALGIIIQYTMLVIFLLLTNFNVLHPILWIKQTSSTMSCFSTWISMLPLICVTILYGIFLGYQYLLPAKYYTTRFYWICSTAPKKALSLFLHGLIGFLTAVIYCRFLNNNYHTIIKDCYGGKCLNPFYAFLCFNGIFSGSYFFFRERLEIQPTLMFPVIQQFKSIQILSNIWSIIRKSIVRSIAPTALYILLYWIFNGIIVDAVASFLDVAVDRSLSSFFSVIINIQLIIYSGLLTSQIITYMYLMDMLFCVLLTEQYEFSIEKRIATDEFYDVTLIEALSLTNFPLGQKLACLDLFYLANSRNTNRRRQVYALSIPGGHRYNWMQIYGQCSSMIAAFTRELSDSAKNIGVYNNSMRNFMPIRSIDLLYSEKVMLRRYNESFGIRNMTMPHTSPTRLQSPSQHSTSIEQNVSLFNRLKHDFQLARQNAIRNVPLLFYLFGEDQGAKTVFLLSECHHIIWIIQALAGLCSFSLIENQYGVVQEDLAHIIKSMFNLKDELDKISNVNVNGRKLDKTCMQLKSAVKRSLYRILTVFGDYIKDILDEPEDLTRAQYFVKYLES